MWDEDLTVLIIMHPGGRQIHLVCPLSFTLCRHATERKRQAMLKATPTFSNNRIQQ